MSQVDLLFHLQKIDDDLRKSKSRLSQVIRLQGESEELFAARERLRQADDELQNWLAQQRELNLEVGTVSAKVKSTENRLYSGNVKNPKELSDLQQGVEAMGRHRSILEDELLEAMIMVDEAQLEHDDAKQAAEDVQERWELGQLALVEEQASLIEHINQLTRQRKQHLELIAPGSLSAYEGVSRRVGTLAVVALKNSRCLGCQVTEPANIVKAVNEGALVTCDSCGRILCPT